jgi:hypothetical protein
MLQILRTCFFGCQHADMYRERRRLHGVDVLHLVCASCGHAVPAIARTASEHQRVAAEGAILTPRAHRQTTAAVVAIERRRSPRLDQQPHRASA